MRYLVGADDGTPGIDVVVKLGLETWRPAQFQDAKTVGSRATARVGAYIDAA